MDDQGEAQCLPFMQCRSGGAVSEPPVVTEGESLVFRDQREGRPDPELVSLHQLFLSLPSLVLFVGGGKKNSLLFLFFFLKTGAVSCRVKDLEEAS